MPRARQQVRRQRGRHRRDPGDPGDHRGQRGGGREARRGLQGRRRETRGHVDAGRSRRSVAAQSTTTSPDDSRGKPRKGKYDYTGKEVCRLLPHFLLKGFVNFLEVYLLLQQKEHVMCFFVF